MSSGIVIMNKSGVAVAADSAVTIGSRSAIFNTAQKLFQVGQLPVSIVNYGSGLMMKVPVDVLYKEFSHHVGNKIVKNTIEEYGRYFLDYLTSERQYFNFPKNEIITIKGWINNLLKALLKNITAQQKSEEKDAHVEENFQTLLNQCKGESRTDVENPLSVHYIQKQYPDSFHDVYIEYASYYFDRNFKINPLSDWDKKVIEKLIDIGGKIARRYYYYPQKTGICFVGYGEKQIYPSLFHFRFFGILQDRPVYFIEQTITIQDNRDSCLLPLAQTDIIDLIVDGTNDEIQSYYFDMYKNQYAKFLQQQLSEVKTDAFDFQTFKKAFEEFTDSLEYVFPEKSKIFTQKLLATVRHLPIPDLGLLAEDLIHIQSIRRKYESDEDWNGTVGGPTDVALITKVGGFVWVKNSK